MVHTQGDTQLLLTGISREKVCLWRCQFFSQQYGMLTIFPRCKFSVELPEILNNLNWYHGLSVSGNSEMKHCGILITHTYIYLYTYYIYTCMYIEFK